MAFKANFALSLTAVAPSDLDRSHVMQVKNTSQRLHQRQKIDISVVSEMWRGYSQCNHWVFQIQKGSILAFSQAQIWEGPSTKLTLHKRFKFYRSLFPKVNFLQEIGLAAVQSTLYNSMLRFVSASLSRLVNSENHKCKANIWVSR